MIYEKLFQFFIGFIFLQLLYMYWYIIIQSDSHVNYTFFLEIFVTDFDM
jgi:hypothetical protein